MSVSMYVHVNVTECSGLLYGGAGHVSNSHRDKLAEPVTAWLRSWLRTRLDDRLSVHCCYGLHESRRYRRQLLQSTQAPSSDRR